MVMLGKLNEIDTDAIASYVTSLQNEDGSFGGDQYNEIDTRFSFCALATLHLIVSLQIIEETKIHLFPLFSSKYSESCVINYQFF